MALTDQTFLQLITRLAHELNDCVTLTATTNGSTTTFVDNVNVNASRESYDGWEWFGTIRGAAEAWRKRLYDPPYKQGVYTRTGTIADLTARCISMGRSTTTGRQPDSTAPRPSPSKPVLR